MPRSKSISTDDVQAQAVKATIPALGPAEITREDIEVVDGPEMMEKADHEAFMNEVVLIQIDPRDENAPAFEYSGNDGERQWIKVGEPQAIKRKFLYSLIAAKTTKYSCTFGRDGQGREFNSLQGRPGTTHRIHVIKDTSRGQDEMRRWLQEV